MLSLREISVDMLSGWELLVTLSACMSSFPNDDLLTGVNTQISHSEQLEAHGSSQQLHQIPVNSFCVSARDRANPLPLHLHSLLDVPVVLRTILPGNQYSPTF